MYYFASFSVLHFLQSGGFLTLFGITWYLHRLNVARIKQNEKDLQTMGKEIVSLQKEKDVLVRRVQESDDYQKESLEKLNDRMDEADKIRSTMNGKLDILISHTMPNMRGVPHSEP